ncbi:MAG: hypothetical protein JXA07_11430 [Spirochaetes bacterium]|nr:hypothetical protein [Spirochaetota bacterium]
MKQPIIKSGTLLSNKFIQLIEENHQELTENFMNDLLKHPETSAYRGADRDMIYESSVTMYKDLSKWISKEFSKEKIAERYVKVGHERFDMGIPVQQAMKGLILQRRHIWLYVMNRMYDDKTDYMEALELNNRVTLYFDRAMLSMLKGYMEMLNRQLR